MEICQPERFLKGVGDLEVTYALHLYIAPWKARVRLPIRHNWTFFANSTVDTL